MKKLCIILLGLVLGPSGEIFGQALQKSVNLSVVLSGAGQTITVNNPIVNLGFTTVSNYINGVHSGSATNDHITVSSSTGFKVTVRGNSDLTNGTSTIPLSTVILTPSNGSLILGTPPVYTALSSGLSRTDQTIITSSVSTLSAKFNIDYYAKGGDNYVGVPIINSPAVYSSVITYTILPL